MCARLILQNIDFPDIAEDLPLCSTVKAKLIKNFYNYVYIPPIFLNLRDKEADPYTCLENEICYGRSLTKRALGIIRNNKWVEEFFHMGEHYLMKHLIVKKLVLMSATIKKEIHVMCLRCYSRANVLQEDDGEVLYYFTHKTFEGTRNAYFHTVFLDVTKWCNVCKITPLFDIYDCAECLTKYGVWLHNDEQSDVVWFEKIDDSKYLSFTKKFRRW